LFWCGGGACFGVVEAFELTVCRLVRCAHLFLQLSAIADACRPPGPAVLPPAAAVAAGEGRERAVLPTWSWPLPQFYRGELLGSKDVAESSPSWQAVQDGSVSDRGRSSGGGSGGRASAGAGAGAAAAAEEGDRSPSSEGALGGDSSALREEYDRLLGRLGEQLDLPVPMGARYKGL
jgi:hypothetical protein